MSGGLVGGTSGSVICGVRRKGFAAREGEDGWKRGGLMIR